MKEEGIGENRKLRGKRRRERGDNKRVNRRWGEREQYERGKGKCSDINRWCM